MKNVRAWFTKEGAAKYISHLDLNRVMLRAVHQARLPIWYTEGFNPHPFLTFALPLSLGYTGKRESMDMRLLEDIPFEEMTAALNKGLPDGIHVFEITEAKMKPAAIVSADFEIKLSDDSGDMEGLCGQITDFLTKEEILIEKKTKSGMKEIDIKPDLGDFHPEIGDGCVFIKTRLPAGSARNLNPSLIVRAMELALDKELYADITRLDTFTESGERFE